MKKQTSSLTETANKDRLLVDYSGKIIYVGIDIHQKDYQVAKLLDGVCLGSHRMSSDSRLLITHLQSRYPGAAFKCVYESCAWGFNLQRSLSDAGMDCIVVHAADVATNDKERKRKSDKVDALKLARNLAAGTLKGIHVPPQTLQKHRNLIRYRKSLTGDLKRSKNRIKSLLKFQGIDIPAKFSNNNWSYNFLNWVEQEAHRDPVMGSSLLLMLEQVGMLRKLLLSTERKLRSIRKESYQSQTDLLMSVPGVGTVTAMSFILEVGDINRFKGFDALNEFIGFCPDIYNSGDRNTDTGITSRSHKQLRSLLVEAAWQAIRTDPALLEAYQQLTKRMKGNMAIIRIARKLLRRIRAVLISGKPYQKGILC